MTNITSNSSVRQVALGRKVDRATASIAATGSTSIFTITGGRIILTSLVGEVTTVIQAQANALKILSTPTTGTAKDISGTFDINALEAGGLVSLDGVALTTALSGTNAGAAIARCSFLIPIGSLKYNTAATNTGSIKWSMTYIPYDDGASVAAA